MLRDVLAGVGALAALISATPVTGWWAGWLSGGDFSLPAGRVLVVLGGGNLPGGLPALDTYWRAVYAGRAWRTGAISRVWVVGADFWAGARGGADVSFGSTAESMRQLLMLQGCPEGAIGVETTSRSTRENALSVARILGPEKTPPILLTSDYHMFRAKRVFAKTGLAVRPYAIPDGVKRCGDWRQRWNLLWEVSEETGKIVYYFLRGWI